MRCRTACKNLLAASVFALVLLGFAAEAADQRHNRPPKRVSTQARLKATSDQLRGLHMEMELLGVEKAKRWEDVAAIRVKKQINLLNRRIANLDAQLQDAQKNGNAAKATALNSLQAILQREAALQSDIGVLLLHLQKARAAMNLREIVNLQAEIQTKRNAILALTSLKRSTVESRFGPIPASVSQPADPAIQALFDEIHVIEARITLDRNKTKRLRKLQSALHRRIRTLNAKSSNGL